MPYHYSSLKESSETVRTLNSLSNGIDTGGSSCDILSMENKKCNGCHRVLPSSSFYVKRKSNTLFPRCKECTQTVKLRHCKGYAQIIDLQGEEWKRIEDSDHFVSNLGRVKRRVSKYSETYALVVPKAYGEGGYVAFNFRYAPTLLHKRMAIAFIPNPENKKYVNHLNGNKADFRLENLEWATKSEDVIHAHATGLNPQRKAVLQYSLDKVFLRKWESIAAAAKAVGKTGNCITSISKACRGIYKQSNGYIWEYAT